MKSNCKEEDWVYINTDDDSARFVLGEPGKKNLVIIGINASFAEPCDENLDPTLKRVKKFSKKFGYDGWLMLNVYPQRATDPKEIHKEIHKKQIKELTERNQEEIKKLFAKYEIDAVWAAWGNNIKRRKFLPGALKKIVKIIPENIKWIKVGDYTVKHHPRHPLQRIKDFDQTKPSCFKIKDYMKLFSHEQ